MVVCCGEYERQVLKRVLMIEGSRGVTGAFKNMKNYADGINSGSEYEVTLLLNREFPKSQIETEILKIIFYKHVEPQINLKSLISIVPNLFLNGLRFRRYLITKNVDIVHVNDINILLGIVLKLLRPRIRLIYHVRLRPNSYLKGVYPGLIKLISRFSDHLLLASTTLSRDLEELKLRNTSVLIDGISSTEHQITYRNSRKLKLIYLANYTRGKGQEVAIELISKLLKSYPDLTLTMAGDTFSLKQNEIYKETLRRRVNDLGLQNVVEILGSQQELEKYFDQGDIFLQLSESESFSMTVLEAMRSGLPVVSTNSGGPSEIIVDGQSGFLVQRSLPDIMQTVERLINDHNLRREVGENGKQRASLYGLDSTLNSLDIVYNKLLE